MGDPDWADCFEWKWLKLPLKAGALVGERTLQKSLCSSCLWEGPSLIPRQEIERRRRRRITSHPRLQMQTRVQTSSTLADLANNGKSSSSQLSQLSVGDLSPRCSGWKLLEVLCPSQVTAFTSFECCWSVRSHLCVAATVVQSFARRNCIALQFIIQALGGFGCVSLGSHVRFLGFLLV